MAEHTKSVKLGEIIREFDLEILHKGPDYEDTPLTTLDVNRPGLPLSGFFEHFDTRRLLRFSKVEAFQRDTTGGGSSPVLWSPTPSVWRWPLSMTAPCCARRSTPPPL